MSDTIGNADTGNMVDNVDALRTAFSRVNVKTDQAQKNDYVMNAVRGTGISWTDISRRPTFQRLQYGSDFTNWVNGEVKRRESNINPSSSFSSRSIGGIHKGGKNPDVTLADENIQRNRNLV